MMELEGSALRKDKYLINLTAGKIECSDADGNVLFNVSETPDPSYSIKFTQADGKVICEIKESQQTPYMEIYDQSNTLLGYVGMQWQLGVAILNDSSNNSIALAMSDGDLRNFKITKTDGKNIMATISVTFDQQNDKKIAQPIGQAVISVQDQSLGPLLLLGFIFAIPKLLPNKSGRRGGLFMLFRFGIGMPFGGRIGIGGLPGFGMI